VLDVQPSRINAAVNCECKESELKPCVALPQLYMLLDFERCKVTDNCGAAAMRLWTRCLQQQQQDALILANSSIRWLYCHQAVVVAVATVGVVVWCSNLLQRLLEMDSGL